MLGAIKLEVKLRSIPCSNVFHSQETDMYHVPFSLTWSRELWTRFALRHLEKSFVPTILFLVGTEGVLKR